MTARAYTHPGINLGETDPEAHDDAEPILFGFWIFLMSDLVIFTLLFATYAAMSQHGVADGPAPHELFELRMPFIETMLLLVSSFTFGFASLALKYDDRPLMTALWLCMTLALGAVFVGLELHDFHKLITEKQAGPEVSGFLSSYFLLTGTHAVHVSAGIVWGLVMLAQLAVFGLVQPVKLRLMRLALFWHMLDVVWIGIFTLVYLFGVIS